MQYASNNKQIKYSKLINLSFTFVNLTDFLNFRKSINQLIFIQAIQ